MLCYICGILFLIILLNSWNAPKIKNKLAKNLFIYFIYLLHFYSAVSNTY